MKQAKDLYSGLQTRKRGKQTRPDGAALDSTNYVRCNNLDFREGTSLARLNAGLFFEWLPSPIPKDNTRNFLDASTPL